MSDSDDKSGMLSGKHAWRMAFAAFVICLLFIIGLIALGLGSMAPRPSPAPDPGGPLLVLWPKGEDPARADEMADLGRFVSFRPSADGRTISVEYGPGWKAHGCRVRPPMPEEIGGAGIGMGFVAECDGSLGVKGTFDEAGRFVPRTEDAP